MDNATKAIMIGVGLFITVIIISAVLVVVNLGTGAMNSATNSMGAMLDNLKSPLDWDGKKEISGADVNILLDNVRANKFTYPVTVLKADGTILAIASPSGVGYRYVIGAPTVVGLSSTNPVYARTDAATNPFWEMSTSQADGSTVTDTGAKLTGNDLTLADGYDVFVMQSRSNSQIGLVFVAN